MIPRHRPPFGIGTVLGTLLFEPKTVSVEMLEHAYAEAFGLYAVLLPSARAGICWALKSTVPPETSVIGPAYTCQVVHEAMVRSGCQSRFIDSEANSFLMDPKAFATEDTENCAVVLCEMYGYSYESYPIPLSPQMRIIDAAMTVPTPHLFNRASGTDCIVLSFGIGKCLYAGFGGIGMSKSKDLIDEMRSRRDASLSKTKLISSVLRGGEIALRTLAHARLLYGLSSKCRMPPKDLMAIPTDWISDTDCSKEWHFPSTLLDRRLAIYNLEHSAEFYDRKLKLAYRYQKNLTGVGGIMLPRPSRYAMSHYTLRVPAQFRDAFQTGLKRLGVDTGTLYKFPSYLSRDQYPNAGKIAGQVLNLPLDACLTDDDVDFISDCVILCLSKTYSASGLTGHDAHHLPGMQGLGH